jgi:hypothetical protein
MAEKTSGLIRQEDSKLYRTRQAHIRIAPGYLEVFTKGILAVSQANFLKSLSVEKGMDVVLAKQGDEMRIGHKCQT